MAGLFSFCMERKRNLNDQNNSEKKKNETGRIPLSGLKIFYKNTITKTVQYWQRGSTEINEIVQGLEIDPQKYIQLIFYESAKAL